MRELDRRINQEIYPKLFYPESYLLEGGFSRFFEAYPELCHGTYMRQDDADDRINRRKYKEMKKQHRDYSAKHQSQLLLQKANSVHSTRSDQALGGLRARVAGGAMDNKG